MTVCGAPSAPPGTAPAGTEQPAGERAQKRTRGAQPGNLNARKHGAFSERPARDQRDGPRRAAERHVRELLAHHGLSKDPTARLVGRALVTLETMHVRLVSYAERRGAMDAKGNVKPATREAIDLAGKLLGEARRLLEQLAGQGSSSPDTLGAAMDKLEARERAATAARGNDGHPLDAPTSGKAHVSNGLDGE
jgi:hypothetical protein